jgi:mono/diheme cytochrome c family protein
MNPHVFVLVLAFLTLVPDSFAAEAKPSMLARFRLGPMSNITEIVFCTRKPNPTDGHWYANIGYYAADPDRKAYRDGGRLCRYNLVTKQTVTLLEDQRGGIRDPQVSYDAKKILFSYRKGGTMNYLLYEINLDGSGLRQITDGDYDDIEPTYLPNGDIVFVSSRCKRWVNCWLTQVATLHRCGPNGENIRAISSNNEQDNTPWPLPDGRILYTRWEYVDRSQVDYHHLWTANPDGTSQMIWFGNLHPGIVMIDAKPVPNSDLVLAIFSPGHGQREHAGVVTLVDPKAGPDAKDHARPIAKGNQYRDPWAFSDSAFMAAINGSIALLDAAGHSEPIWEVSGEEAKAEFLAHEPRPVIPRLREVMLVDRANPVSATGKLVLANIYEGRAMEGLKKGEIKEMLVLETLPMPIHYTGGMDPVSYGGTFTLERVLGTVPVEPDGSAYLEVPAMRSLILVALNDQSLAVKRMQSFLTVQPGETTSCVGCHEQRSRTPGSLPPLTALAALQRPASRIQPVVGVPDVIDFPRDIQPILDRHCVSCHGYDKTAQGGPRAGRLVLSGDHGPMFSHSYYMLTIGGLFADGRNLPRSNYAPKTLGSGASRLLNYFNATHYQAKADARELTLLRLWIDSGAAYPGTYAALGTGMIGGYEENSMVNSDAAWPTTAAGAQVIDKRCAECHRQPGRILPRALSDERGVSFWRPDMKDPRLLTSRHIIFNLTQPANSLLLLAPLAADAGGWGLCRATNGAPVFTSTADPDYQTLLAMCSAGRDYLDRAKRFDMPGFEPRKDWVRELKRYGILSPQHVGQINPYTVEQEYWKSLWHQPSQ